MDKIDPMNPPERIALCMGTHGVTIWTHGPMPDEWKARYPAERIHTYQLVKPNA